MFKAFITIACILFIHGAVANVNESMTIRIFDPDVETISREEVEKLVQQANLLSLGYKKITEIKTVTDFQSGLPVRKEALRFLKKMRCSEFVEAEKLLNELFPGSLNEDVARRTKLKMKELHLKNKHAMCISGIEFHFSVCEQGRSKRAARRHHCCRRRCLMIDEIEQ
ncbi:uncharacterized protein LOC124454056 [Xenia sp. Carnegie-2017]|uniref:uncharacterized protein LOC124454056 n=1 Tax=Xenia sp. Carnegie-2017 TaxID=2897299 RepID=UPI001F037DDB|nr:uncharacterized protein LOC124454056 [Xenia sp. Carnegie-2017]